MERRKITSILSEEQLEAWEAENVAQQAKTAGNPELYKWEMAVAKEFREDDMHNKIITLFEYSDAQNDVIDIGLKLAKEGKKLPEL